MITDTGDLGALEDDWRELAVAQANAFITPEWFVAWRDTLAERQLPFVLEVRHDSGQLAGVMPLAQDRAAIWPRATRFAGSSKGDRFGIAARKEDEVAVATAAIAAIEHMERAPALTILHRVDAAAGWPEAMAQAARKRLTLVEQSHSQLPYATVQGLEWAGYLATRSKKFRQRVPGGWSEPSIRTKSVMPYASQRMRARWRPTWTPCSVSMTYGGREAGPRFQIRRSETPPGLRGRRVGARVAALANPRPGRQPRRGVLRLADRLPLRPLPVRLRSGLGGPQGRDGPAERHRAKRNHRRRRGDRHGARRGALQVAFCNRRAKGADGDIHAGAPAPAGLR